MKIRNLDRYQFEFVGTIEPALDHLGHIAEYRHDLPPRVRPNRYASGPFCRFELSDARNAAGVYAVMFADIVKYVGECENLAARFGRNGYGYIAARNCHHDGQATNCKVNSLILASARAGERIDVWFHETARRKEVEAELLTVLKPGWNGTRGTRAVAGTGKQKLGAPRMTGDEFRVVLQAEFDKGARAGQHSLRMRAGDLHRAVGGYPGQDHRMALCCSIMKSAMRSGDKIIESPPSGKGANLLIEYRLPRPAKGGVMKPAALVATIFLALIALAHVLRVALRVQVTVGGTDLPMWMSVVACIFTGGLAIVLWRENRP